MKISLGIDESYENKISGIFVLNCILIKSEKDFLLLEKVIENTLIKNNLKEIKNSKTDNKLRKKIFLQLKDLNFVNYVYEEKIKSTKEILSIYKNAVVEVFRNINLDMNTKIVDVKIDTIGGLRFQKEIYKEVSFILKSKKVKHSIRFLDSSKSVILQMADIFAGEYRKLYLGKSNFSEFLNKNKILLLKEFTH